MPLAEPIRARGITRDMISFNIDAKRTAENSGETSENYAALAISDDIRQGELLNLSDGHKSGNTSDGAIAAALMNGTSGMTIQVKYEGLVKCPLATFEVGRDVYLTEGSPNITTTPPDLSVVDSFRYVGWAISQTEYYLSASRRVYLE